MANKKKVSLLDDPLVFVLGIASNEKIWTVCWNINQKMDLEMMTGVQDVTQVKTADVYRDSKSDPDFEYLLFENNNKSNKVPKLAREFRYWLVIRPLREKSPKVPELIALLNEEKSISLVLDLSEQKDIKHLIP